MAILKDEELRQVVYSTIAKQILDGLDQSHRDAILQESIADALGDYKFRNAVNEVVADKATKVAKKLVESDDWTARIEQAIRDGFDDYLVNLRTASQTMLKDAFHGKTSSYGGSHASIVNCWPATK